MARLENFYLQEVRAWLPGRRCAVYPDKLATQCHHVRGRLGTLRIDKRFWKGVSMEGHVWIDANRDEARRRGLLADRGEWHVAPADDETRRLKALIVEITR